MKLSIQSILTLIFVLCTGFLVAQTGTIRGTMIDDATGEPIMFANVLVEQTQSGTTSDLDGKYELELPVGTYTFVFSYLGYTDLPVTDIVVKDGQVEVLDVRMVEESEMLEQVVVTAKQIRNTEAALATIKRKSINLVDGLSSQSFKKTGDGDAGEALQRVTGVSVEGGKHVVVRGLGDRYTKTILNNVEIPGLDPDKNSVQMDLFPTNLIDNILVYKTFSPNLPGDFTGGAVDIITKDFPERQTFSVGASIGYNPDMHFRDDFLSYDGGSTDLIGYDDGTRELGFSKNSNIPDVTKKSIATQKFTESFNPTMASTPQSNNVDKSISISTGNQLSLGKGKFGYIAALNYGHSYTHYDNVEFNEYLQNVGEEDYDQIKRSTGITSTENVQWSALGGVSYKLKNHKFGVQVFKVQDADKIGGKFLQADLEFNDSKIQRDNVEYYQRSITNVAVTGGHVFGKDANLKIDWKFAPSFVDLSEPDIRTTGFDVTEEGEEPAIFPSIGADITRIWRNLQETNYNGRADVTYEFKMNNGDAKIKAGIYTTVKERDFEILNYLFRVKNQFSFGFKGDPNNILKPENIWTPESHPSGVYVIGNYQAANTFNATQQVLAAYVMSEMPITKKLKATYGVRVEKADNTYTGTNNQGTVSYDKEKVLDELNLLPSVNLIYEVADKTNIRLSANRTVARPTFKEASIAQIQDRISGRTFLGNIDIEQSTINNFDLRFEKFFAGADIASISLFYKQFFNPIQLVVFSPTTPSNYQPKNLDDTDVYGFEVEGAKSLGFIDQKFSNFTVNANFTYVNSTMPLIGLSPSIFNGGLSYNGRENGWNASLVYNVQGRRLSIVGVNRVADVYDVPFKSLNLKVGKNFGSNKAYSVSFAAENLLDSARQRDYDTNNEQLAIFDRFEPGRKFTLSFGYTLK